MKLASHMGRPNEALKRTASSRRVARFVSIYHFIRREYMEYIVKVSFRKNSDYSNANKNIIISCLPGPYKIPQNNLNDMDQLGVHSFEFQNLNPANNFASELFKNHNSLFDIETNFKIE